MHRIRTDANLRKDISSLLWSLRNKSRKCQIFSDIIKNHITSHKHSTNPKKPNQYSESNRYHQYINSPKKFDSPKISENDRKWPEMNRKKGNHFCSARRCLPAFFFASADWGLSVIYLITWHKMWFILDKILLFLLKKKESRTNIQERDTTSIKKLIFFFVFKGRK